METAVQELVYQLVALIVSGVVGMVGLYAKAYIKNKMEKMDYEFENSKVERLLDNAVHYAEAWGKTRAREYSNSVTGSDKMSVAVEYINKVDKDVITKYGNELELMLDRKVTQVLNK